VKHIVGDNDQLFTGDVREQRLNELLVKNTGDFVERISLA